MTSSWSTLGDYRRRRRRTVLWRLVQGIVALAVVALGTGYAYRVGTTVAEVRVHKLEADLARFQEANLELRDRLTVAARERADAQGALAELRRRYAEDVPGGVAAELLREVRRQLDAGAEPERLALLIAAAAAPEACDGAPETKRFIVRTPVGQGPVSAVRFGGDRITVTGTGASTLNSNNLPEAWYDPAEPVRLAFRTLDGALETVEGVLPLAHRLVVDRREYRFSAVAGERSFVEVTAQACALPEASARPPARAGSAVQSPTAGLGAGR
jgi:hypothetical protein